MRIAHLSSVVSRVARRAPCRQLSAGPTRTEVRVRTGHIATGVRRANAPSNTTQEGRWLRPRRRRRAVLSRMPRTQILMEKENTYGAHNYHPLPVVRARARRFALTTPLVPAPRMNTREPTCLS